MGDSGRPNPSADYRVADSPGDRPASSQGCWPPLSSMIRNRPLGVDRGYGGIRRQGLRARHNRDRAAGPRLCASCATSCATSIPAAIYHHFWGTLLRPQFVRPGVQQRLRLLVPPQPPRQPAGRAPGRDRPGRLRRHGGAAPGVDRGHRRAAGRDRGACSSPGPTSSSTSPARSSWSSTPTGGSADPAELVTALPDTCRWAASSITSSTPGAGTPAGVDDFRAWLSGLGPEYAALIDSLAGDRPLFRVACSCCVTGWPRSFAALPLEPGGRHRRGDGESGGRERRP